MTQRKSIARRLAYLLPIGLSCFALDAAATAKSGCVVTSVGYDLGRLQLQCSGDANIYYGLTSEAGGTCPKQSAETVKIWTTMLESALLSGKVIDIDYTSNTVAGCVGLRSLNFAKIR